MDKIVFIDFLNSVYRASVGFASKHDLCPNTCTEHKLSITNTIHCICGAKIDPTDNICIGEKYSVPFVFFRSLRYLMEEFQPDKCFIVQEGYPQFRYDLYPEYKANRIIKTGSTQSSNKEKVMAGKDIILPILKNHPITLVTSPHYEADDVIGTLCENMKDEDITVLSNDTDYIQLLQRGYKNLTVYAPSKKEHFVAPDYHYIGWKCLNGDKSDNIKKLLSPKKAISTISDPKLLREFLSIQENQDNFNINKKLIEFAKVPESEIVMENCVGKFDAVKMEFEKMEMNTITNDKSWEKYVKTFDCLKF